MLMSKKLLIILIFSFFTEVLFYSCTAKNSSLQKLKLENITQLNSHTFTCSFDGIEHDFIVELPQHCDGAPLVILLPGYSNTADYLRFTHIYNDSPLYIKVLSDCIICNPKLLHNIVK